MIFLIPESFLLLVPLSGFIKVKFSIVTVLSNRKLAHSYQNKTWFSTIKDGLPDKIDDPFVTEL
jgi:hypothetical protein